MLPDNLLVNQPKIRAGCLGVGATHEHISYEHSVEIPLLKKLCQFNPVFDIVEVPGPIAGVSPKPRRLMSTARLDERIDD